MEGHRRSRKVKEGHGRSLMVFSHHWIDISSEKSYWWWVVGWCWPVRIILSAPIPIPFFWTLDFGFWTWIFDLDFWLRFWTGPGLDNIYNLWYICSCDRIFYISKRHFWLSINYWLTDTSPQNLEKFHHFSFSTKMGNTLKFCNRRW